MRKIKLAACVAALLSIAACGGGGGGSSSAPGSTTGFWKGTVSTGASVAAAVFPSGETWAIYVNGGTIGVVQGTMNGAATEFSSTGSVTSGTITGTAVTKQSISGTAGAATYSGTYNALFEQTPSLAAAAGTYAGSGPSAGTTITVAAGGGVTVTSATCTATGSATPRTDGNAFNVSLTYAGGGCPVAGQTMTGVAVYDGSDRSLIGAAVNTGRTAAALFTGNKP